MILTRAGLRRADRRPGNRSRRHPVSPEYDRSDRGIAEISRAMSGGGQHRVAGGGAEIGRAMSGGGRHRVAAGSAEISRAMSAKGAKSL